MLTKLNATYSNSTLNLSYRNLTGPDLLLIARELPLELNIRTLKLGFNDLQDEGARIISEYISMNKTLTCLDLGFCNISDVGLEALTSKLSINSTLKVLYLSGNSITSVGFKYLGSALAVNKCLHTLFLTGNSGKADGARNIAKGLKYNTTLEKLFINGNKLEKDGISSISDTLLTNHSIKQLSLSDNNIGDSGMLSLSEALSNHRNLKDLELSFNKISHIGMNSFIDCLIGYHNLSRLLLDNNKLGDAGAKALSLAIPHMQLQDLNVGFNDIGSEGLMCILSCLIQNNCSIRSIVLSGNTIDNNVAKALANVLSSNTTLNALYIDRTNLSSIGERYIATAIASNRKNPLKTLTGFELGKVLISLGSPQDVLTMNNEAALKYLAQMWMDVERNSSATLAHSTTTPSTGNLTQSSSLSSFDQSHTNYHTVETPKEEERHFRHIQPHNPDSNNPNNVPEGSTTTTDSPTTISDQTESVKPKKPSKLVLNFEPISDAISNAPKERRDILIATKQLVFAPFNVAELWELHQYYYSPPPLEHSDIPDSDLHYLLPNSLSSDASSVGIKSSRNTRLELEINNRPTKRAGNMKTMSRISNYQKVKQLLELYKVSMEDNKTLILLRQLRYLEEMLRDLDPLEIERILIEDVMENMPL